jgi:3D (Asp-Asp-Asp) domain-containing protein
MARNDRPLQLRRRRLRQAAMLRALARRRRAAFVTTSVGVFVVSLLSMFAVAQAFNDQAPVPLLMVESQPAIAAPVEDVAAVVAPVQSAPATVAEAVEPSAPQPDAAPVEPAAEPVAASVPQASRVPAQTFNRRPVRVSHQMRMLVTAYCPKSCCCGKHADGITASGHSIATNGGNLVAADTRLLPFGSLVQVPGYDSDRIVPVLDRGGKIKGHRLDLLMSSHQQAKRWGARWLTVTIYEYAD